MIRIFYFILLVLALFFGACSKDQTPVPVPVDCADTISYSLQIQPLLDLNCNTSGCHNSGSAQAGFDLTSYGNVSSSSDDVFAAMNHTGPNPMPIGADKINDSLIEQFRCWIQQGKLNN